MFVRNAAAASRSDRPSKDCRTITVATTSARHRRPPPPRREQIREHLVREQLAAVISQERVHRVLGHQMAAQRRRVQQLNVRVALAQHPPSVPRAHRKREHHTSEFFNSDGDPDPGASLDPRTRYMLSRAAAAAKTATALRPATRFGPATTVEFVVGVPISEMPLQAAADQGALARLGARGGRAGGWRGAVGLV